MNTQNQRKNLLYSPLKKQDQERKLKIAVVDIETRSLGKQNGEIEVKIIGYFNGKKDFYFSSIADFVNFLLSHNQRNYKIYAHNGGKFDFLPIAEELSRRKIPYHITQIAGRLAQIKIITGNNRVTLRDSICILPDKLSRLAKAFGVVHQKGEIDFDKEEFDKTNPVHMKYLEHDLKGTYEVLTKFFNTEKVRDVTPKLTIASTSLAVHRTTLKAPVRKSPNYIQNFCRQAYVGGRVEIFKHDGHNLNSYDFNSIYPFCMRSFPTPVEYIGEAQDYEDFGFHKVTIYCPKNINIPVLPIKINGKLIFPTGLITGIFFSEEIKLAISVGYKLIKYHYGEEFSREFDFFREYVDFFYKLRQENKGTSLDYISKLFLNSLYGKFGQKEEFSSLQTINFDNEVNGEIFGNEEIFNKFGLIVSTVKKRSPHMLVHIASSITSHARIHLYRSGLSICPDNIRYCDTDSLYTPGILETSRDLGRLKLEESNIDYGYFRLPKTYALVKNGILKIKCKGFPEKLLENITLDQFKNSKLELSRIKVLGFKSAIKRFNSSFVETEFKKSLQSCYDKRKTLANGIDTRPWHLNKEGKLI